MIELHIEIKSMETVKSGADHIYLLNKGWIHEGDNGMEDLYTNPSAFDAHKVCRSDAVKLQKIIDDWEQETNDK